jgi:hypothetical protein
MALDHFGFIFTGRGLEAGRDRVVMERDGFRAVIVGMSSPEGVEQVAVDLVAEGVQLIELCGGFGSVWTARVLEATGGKVPVGSVGYGPESIDGMAALFPPAH